MNDLEKFFWQESDRYIHKWSHYFYYYDKYFAKYRNRPIKVLEIGVFEGGSLQMWRNYFGNESLIVGMDINRDCINYIEDGIDIFIGDQGSLYDLRKLVEKYGKFDIIIDDGSHQYVDQITSFEYLFDFINESGIYLVEDTHTSYFEVYQTGKETFIEYSKKIVDEINGYHTKNGEKISKLTTILSGIYFHDSLVFFEKHEKSIVPSLPVYSVGMKFEKNKL